MLEGIHWLGHASFRIDDQMVIYIDPWKLETAMPADLVLVTHGHRDHLSIADIARITQESTVIVCPPSCKDQLSGDVREIRAGESLRIGQVSIEAVPSYNTNKPNHPQEAGNVGYIVEVGGRRIYHAGDTDLIPEMATLVCDVALLPMGGTYTMDAAEAAQAAIRIGPQIVIPMHWGDIVGSRADVASLAKQLPQEIQLIVLDPER